MRHYVSFFLCLTLLSSCGLRSNQLDFVRNLLDSNKDAKGPKPTWVLDWSGFSLPVYPINVGTSIWFAGREGVLVKFDGWQVTEVNGLISSSKMYIDWEAPRMIFLQEKMIIEEASCDPWSDYVDPSVGSVVYKQVCSNKKMGFRNLIEIDQVGNIVKLDFRFHENYPNLTLRPRKNDLS